MVEFFVSNRRNRCEPAIARFAWLGALVGASLSIFCGLCIAQSTQAPSPETQMHLQRARDALKANAADTAVNEYRAVLEMEPKNIEANANLGVMAFFQGDCAKASGYFSAALAVQPSIPKAQALLGICEKRMGAPSAQARLEKSFSEISDPKLRIQVGTELAGLYYQKGDLRRTASLIQSLIELAPDDVDILYFGQLVYTEMSDEMLAKLVVLAPGSARMQQVIGERLINGGDLPGAIEHFRKALKTDPRLPGVRFELSEAVFESAQSAPAAQAEAVNLLEEASRIEGDNAKIECELGAIAVMRSDTDQALAHYTKAFALNPKETEAQMGLGRLLMEKKEPDEAMKYLRMAIESDPLNGEAHYRLGLAYRDTGSMDAAAQELKLFQEIKKTKDQVKELYKQMNKQPRTMEDRTPDAQKND